MKMRLLASTIAALQIGAAALPTIALAAQDRGRDQHRQRQDVRTRSQSRDQQRHEQRRAPAIQQRAPAQQRYTPPRSYSPQRSYMRDPHRGGVDLRRWDRGPSSTYRHDRWRQALPFRHSPRYYAPLGRTRYYRDIFIIRPYGHWYSGYGFYYHDNDAWRFLAFTAITLAILNLMTQSQQRALESAQIQATTAPIGAPIEWREGNSYGTVTATRDGRDSQGRYCREFQQQVTVGSRTEEAYGTACQRPDGSWQIIATD